MAEAIAIIGLIASVQGILALINGGAKGVKLSLKLYQAPAEMEALQVSRSQKLRGQRASK